MKTIDLTLASDAAPPDMSLARDPGRPAAASVPD